MTDRPPRPDPDPPKRRGADPIADQPVRSGRVGYSPTRRRRARWMIAGGTTLALVIAGIAFAALGPASRPDGGPKSATPTGQHGGTQPSAQDMPAAVGPAHARLTARVQRTTAPSTIGRSTTLKTRPVVYVQAGHQSPGEPGYLWQTGASGGPFGSEEAFNVRLAPALEAKLRAAGVIVHHTPALVTPWGADGAVFISLHFDAVGGSAGIGYAVAQPGRGENYYQGNGSGTASSVPYPHSAAHRHATKVTYAVQQHSLKLANDLAATFRPVFTPANGTRSHFRGVEPGAKGNVRMQFFYGYYRVNTGARVLIECGAAGTDNRFLTKVNLMASSIGSGIIKYLRQTGQLG